MRQEGEKKRGLLLIARILKERTDASHPLSQQQILEILAEEFDVHIDRKSVRRNLSALTDAGWPIRFYEKRRKFKRKTEVMTTGWYWEALISDEEAEILSDLFRFAPLAQKNRSDLLTMLNGMTGPFTDLRRSETNGLSDPTRVAFSMAQKEMVKQLAAAIRKRVKIGFYYCYYGMDGRWHRETDDGGNDRRRIVHPFRILAAGGIYLLLACDDGTDEVRLYPVSRIEDISLTDEPRRPVRSLEALKFGIHPEDHISVSTHLYEGAATLCLLEMKSELLTECLQDFYGNIRIASAGERTVQVEINAPPLQVGDWALVHGDGAKVIAPPALVRQTKEAAMAAARQYEYV